MSISSLDIKELSVICDYQGYMAIRNTMFFHVHARQMALVTGVSQVYVPVAARMRNSAGIPGYQDLTRFLDIKIYRMRCWHILELLLGSDVCLY